jgi:hypothetical protein
VCFSVEIVWRWGPERRGVWAREVGGQPWRVKSQIGLRDSSVKSVSSVFGGSTGLTGNERVGEGGGYQAISFRDTNWCIFRLEGEYSVISPQLHKTSVFPPTG